MFSFLLVYYTQEWNYWVGSWVVVVVKSLSDNAGDMRHGFYSWVRKIP